MNQTNLTIIVTFALAGLLGVAVNAYAPEESISENRTLQIDSSIAVEASSNDLSEAISLEEKDYEQKNEPQPEAQEKTQEIVKPAIHHTSSMEGLANHYNTYKEVYKHAPDCHPYILASIHYRETNFGNTNGWNGQGAFQNIRNRYAGGSVVTDWKEQTIQACEHLRQSVAWAGLTNLDDFELVGTALARYNGCRGQYYKQCSYVVNRTNLMAVGTKCAVDGCAYTTTDNRYGALSIVSQLREMNI